MVAAHGVRGLARVRPYNPGSPSLASCEEIWLRRPKDLEPTRFRVTQCRPHKAVFLMALDGIASRNALEPWVRSEVYVEASTLPPPAPGEVYHFEAIGLAVRTTQGETVGKIVDVLPAPASDLWVIESDRPGGPREILVPAVEPIVREIDLAQRTAVIDPPAGLLDDEA